MSWSKIVKGAMETTKNTAKKGASKAKPYADKAISAVKKHPYISAGAGIVGAGAIADMANTSPKEMAIDLYKQGKSIEEIQQMIPDLPEEVLQELMATEEYNQNLASNDNMDLILSKGLYGLMGDKSLERILAAKQQGAE